MSQIYLVDINFYICTFPPPPILCSVSIVIVINNICCTQSLIIIMANTNRRNPNAGEPTCRSGRAAGKRPTALSPLLQHNRYDLGKRKDLPESFPLPLESTVQQGTDSNTQRKDLPKDSHKDSTKDSPRMQLTIEENKQILEERKQHLLLQHPHWVARGGDNRPPDESPIQPPSLVPQIENPLALGTMPTLVRLQDGTTAAIIARRYPE